MEHRWNRWMSRCWGLPPGSVSEHLGVHQQTTKCTICEREFNNVRGLNVHLRTCKRQLSRSQNNQGIQTQNQNPHGMQNQNQIQCPNRVQITITVWGKHSAEELMIIGNAIYEEIVFWKKNLFKLPSGAAGKLYIKEMIRLIHIWVEDNKPVSKISLKLLMVMPAVLLQKPCRKSKAKQHKQYLKDRMIG